jgi:hypothetical protein
VANEAAVLLNSQARAGGGRGLCGLPAKLDGGSFDDFQRMVLRSIFVGDHRIVTRAECGSAILGLGSWLRGSEAKRQVDDFERA